MGMLFYLHFLPEAGFIPRIVLFSGGSPDFTSLGLAACKYYSAGTTA